MLRGSLIPFVKRTDFSKGVLLATRSSVAQVCVTRAPYHRSFVVTSTPRFDDSDDPFNEPDTYLPVYAFGSVMSALKVAGLGKILYDKYQKRPKPPSHILPPGKPDFPAHDQQIHKQNIEKAFKTLEKRQTDSFSTVYVVGMPGTGKSELARQFATDAAKSTLDLDYFSKPDFVWFVDMRKFTEGYYRSFANHFISNGADSDSSKTQVLQLPLNNIASKFKKEFVKWKWLIVLDNYESVRMCNTFEGDSLKMLLPHPGSNGWGKGRLLITTTDTITPDYSNKVNPAFSTYRIGPLSAQDGTTLLCRSIAPGADSNYKMTSNDKDAFGKVTKKQHWRLFPSEIVYVGMKIQETRKQERYRNYTFSDYCEDTSLKLTPLNHPNECTVEHLTSVLADNVPSLKAVFRLLAFCPHVSSVVVERLFEKLFGAKSVADGMDYVKSCVLFDIDESDTSYVSSVSVHRLTQDIFKKLFWDLPDASDQEKLEFLAQFVECIVEEYDDLFFESHLSRETSKLQQKSLVNTLDMLFEEYISNDDFPRRLKIDAICILSTERLPQDPDGALRVLTQCLKDSSDLTDNERAYIYFHIGKVCRVQSDNSIAMNAFDEAIRLSSRCKRQLLMYQERADLKRKLDDYYGAINDLDTVAHTCSQHTEDKFKIAYLQAHIGWDLYEAKKKEKGVSMTKNAVEICNQERVMTDSKEKTWIPNFNVFSSWTSDSNDSGNMINFIDLSVIALRGMVLSEEGNQVKAIELFKKAQELLQRAFPKNKHYATRLNALVHIAEYKNGKTKKLKVLKQAEATLDCLDSESDYQISAFFCLEYAKALHQEKQWKEAIKYAQHVIFIIENAYGSLVHPKVAQAHPLLGQIHYSMSIEHPTKIRAAGHHMKRTRDICDKLIESAQRQNTQRVSEIVEMWEKIKKETYRQLQTEWTFM